MRMEWKPSIFLLILVLLRYCNALDRTVIRQRLVLHRISQSARNIDPFYSEEAVKRRFKRQASDFPSDDEDFNGSGESLPDARVDVEPSPSPLVAEPPSTSPTDWVWYRTKVNFLDSIEYNEALTDYNTDAFADLSNEIMVDVEEYLRTQLEGYHEATPLMFSKLEDDVMVLIDVGLCMPHSVNDVTNALMSLASGGHIGRFRVSEEGFSIRQIGIDTERQECSPGPTLPSVNVPAPTSESKSPSLETTTEPTPPGINDTRVGSTTPVLRPTQVPACRVDQATCKNRQCIDRSYVCDGTVDCLDGSDEPDSCSVFANQCDPTEFLCIGTGICVQKIWRCDGDDDCGNGYDESNCPTAAPESRCEAIQFECRNRVCIPSSYQCDGETDCQDGSDEEDCSAPIVITPPEHFVNAVEGDTVTLECEAIGVPNPVISWRVNWANVPPPPRVTMATKDGKGTLTIRKIKLSDQGAYTCEAMNPNGSKLGTPDAVVTVEEKPKSSVEPTFPPEPIIPTGRVETSCPPGEFNTSPDYPDACKRCYCFGVTDQCTSSKLQFSKVGIEFTKPNDKQGVKLQPEDVNGDPERSKPITENQIDVNPPARELQLIDLSKRFLAAAHYWSLPAQFLGAKINSYGGTLAFSFSYNTSYHIPSTPTNHSDVILEGNGKKLHYKSQGPHPEATIKHKTEVVLEEEQFKTAAGKPVSREEMLNVLGKLDRVLLRTVYDKSMLSTGIGDVKLSVAERTPSHEGANETQEAGVIAYTVEECICPEGYEGLSCESCSPGFERVLSGPMAGRCLSEQQQDSSAGIICDLGYTGKDCLDCAEGYTPYEGGCTRYPDTYCNVAGSIGINLGQVCDCKPGCKGQQCDECKPGYYFLSEENPDGCLECFCMGVSNACNSSKWNITKIEPGFQSVTDFAITNAGTRRTFHDNLRFQESLDGGSQPEVTARLSDLPDDIYYWVLPQEFTGNKLASYGGKLDYTVRYSESPGGRAVSGTSNARISGNGIVLDYVSDIVPEPSVDTRFVIELTENYWLTRQGSPASREELMLVLSNVENFLIRSSYSSRMESTTIKNLYLDSALPRRTGGSVAYKVEECSCPPGYAGLSCESCTSGYYRVESGEFLGTCEPCDCNGHSSDCDSNGICRDCRHDTMGDHCEVCEDGFYGNARAGQVNDCQRCPCPTLNGRTDQGRVPTCRANADGDPVCDHCPQGYDGDRCETCAPGYVGNPLVPDSPCRRTDTYCQCDPVGSVAGGCNDFGECTCKPSTTGRRCDQCKPGFFYLSIENEAGGCLPCFCMGITRQCTSSTYKRNEVTSDFASDYGGYVLTQRERRNQISEGFDLLNQGRTLSYPRADTLPTNGGAYYWRAPEEYKGNKIVSYGGKLRYKASYTNYATSIPSSDPDVILTGNDITIMAVVSGRNSLVRPGIVMDRSIVFRENRWHRADGQPATREDLLMALADVEDILIRATYSPTMLRTSISDVAMETASESVLMSEPAYEVEQCECPNGYEGLSCEDCAAGFTRSASGIYLGVCHLCQCNGHADLCDSESGICVNCRHNTIGDRCEVCARGYYGDATQGTPNDCRPCACPGTGANSFSDSCRLDSSTDSLVCTACKLGYTGNRCETCAPGYEGSPSSPGGLCRRRDARPESGHSPEVDVSPKSVNAKEGASIAIRCFVNSPNPVAVIWRRGGSNVGPLPRGVVVSSTRRTLRFPAFTASQAGTYQCSARNRFGSDSDSAVITLARESPMIKVRVEEPREVRVRVGSEVSFVCTATSKMPAFIVSWTKQNDMLPLSRVTDFDGILHVTNVQPSDSGTYICTGSNMYSTDQETATLLVVEGNEASRPTAEVNPKNQSVSAGDDAMFYCTTRGEPTPSIEWRRGDGRAMSNNVHAVGNMLMIPSASVDDRSLYYCRATNPHGIAEATGALDVEEKGIPPTVRVVTPEVTLTVGDHAELVCSATGDPTPEITWSKRGRSLASNTAASGGTLRLTSVTSANQGIYQCTADNLFGQDSGFIRVTVNQKDNHQGKPICRTEPKEVTTYVGTNSTITCVVGGDPVPSVTWETDDGSELDDNIKVVGEKMFINKVRQSNAGKYVCVATNRYGVSRSKMTVYVVKKDLPKVVITPSRQLKVKSGQDASFTCLAPGQIDADITWLRSEQKLFTGNTFLSNGNSKLNFRNISVKEAGSYMCVASNVVGHREAGVYIYVIQPPIITVKPAKFIDMTEGDSIDLVCKVVGAPTPSVVWLNVTGGGSPKMLTNYRLRSNLYSIRRVRLADAGEYFCRATNEGGYSQEKVVLMVHKRVIRRGPVVSVESSTATSTAGESVRLRCDASGYPPPSITWSKLEGELPEGSSQSAGILYIPSTTDTDGGKYVCSARNSLGQDAKSVDMRILVLPLLEIRPHSRLLLVPGETRDISCKAVRGTDPVAYSWSKSGSPSPLVSGSKLKIVEFDPVLDVGTYTCTATNQAGTSTSSLEIQEAGPPVTNASPRTMTTLVGQAAEFFCTVDVNSDTNDVIPRWDRTDGRAVDTERFATTNGNLHISDVQLSDATTYECSASNAAGSSSDSVTLFVQAIPRVELHLQGGRTVVREGEDLLLTCNATGTPTPVVKMFKDGQEIELNTQGEYAVGTLTPSDTGLYSCFASNDAGSSSVEKSVIVYEIPHTRIEQPEMMFQSGGNLLLNCIAEGAPEPNITWTKLNGTLLESAVSEGQLRLEPASVSDTGVYVCTAANEAGTNSTRIHAYVHAFIPYFTQTPLSYVAVTIPENKFYTMFNITVSFRPNVLNGLLFFSDSSNKDFISLSLSEGIVQFRYDVGSGPVTIRSRSLVEKGQWNTVSVSRMERKGELLLNNDEVVKGRSPGEFRGLELTSDLYVGGVPGVVSLPQPLQHLGSDSGFYGCISQLKIGTQTIDIGSSDQVTERFEVVRCKTCGSDSERSPCENQSTCVESHDTMSGHVCHCDVGYIGDSCQFKEDQICLADTCGSHGTCHIDLGRQLGYKCECDVGYVGPLCQNMVTTTTIATMPAPVTNSVLSNLFAHGGGELIRPASLVARKDDSLELPVHVLATEAALGALPAARANPTEASSGNKFSGPVSFTQDSFMMSRTIRASQLRRTDITMRIRRRSHADGLLLFSGGTSRRSPFISLSIRNGALEFRFNNGLDVTILRAPTSALGVGSWHTIRAIRRRGRGKLEVDGRNVARARSSGPEELRLNDPLYIGGAKFWEHIPDKINVRDGFDGCIESLSIDRMDVPFDNAFVRKNTGRCKIRSKAATTPKDATLHKVSKPRYSAKFTGSSYTSFDASVFQHDEAAEQISLRFRTTEPYGLILFHGEDLVTELNAVSRSRHRRRPSGRRRSRSKDFISMGVQGSYLVYRFDLGGGQAKATSRFSVSDGMWHTVTIVRRGTLALMWMDDMPIPVATQSRGSHSVVNAPGRLYLGGTPDVIFATAGRYTTGFNGCLKDVRLTPISIARTSELGASYLDDSSSVALDFSRSGSLERINVRTCMSLSEENVN